MSSHAAGRSPVAMVLSGVGLFAYLVAWIVIPEAGEADRESPARPESRHSAAVLGAVLIGVGAMLGLRAVVPWFDTPVFWPLVVVVGGLALVVSNRRPEV